MVKFLDSITSYLFENKEWLFSGLGLSVISFAISYFKKRSRPTQDAITINGSGNQIASVIINCNYDVVGITILSVLLGLIIFSAIGNFCGGLAGSIVGLIAVSISLGTAVCSWYVAFSLYRKSITRKLEVENIYLSSINNTNSNISMNKWINFIEITHTYVIKKFDLYAENMCEGRVTSKQFDNSVAFSVFGESVNVDSAKAYGFDLISDPEEKHRIIPIPVKQKNISSILKIPLSANSNSKIGDVVRCKFVTKITGCMKYGKDYVSAYAASSTKTPIRFMIRLRFENDFPQNVRVYHIDYSDFLPKIKFDGILYQESNSPFERTYVDEAIIKSRHYQKIYIFERERGKLKSNSLRS